MTREERALRDWAIGEIETARDTLERSEVGAENLRGRIAAHRAMIARIESRSKPETVPADPGYGFGTGDPDYNT